MTEPVDIIQRYFPSVGIVSWVGGDSTFVNFGRFHASQFSFCLGLLRMHRSGNHTHMIITSDCDLERAVYYLARNEVCTDMVVTSG